MREGDRWRHSFLPALEADIPRGVRYATLKKAWAEAKIDEKWANSSRAKKMAAKKRRANLTDFERFQVMLLRKQRSQTLRRAMKKAKREAKTKAQ